LQPAAPGRRRGDRGPAPAAVRAPSAPRPARPPPAARRRNGHLSNVDFRVADVTTLELPAGAYDVIFSNWLLMYLSDDEVAALVRNALRWVRALGGARRAARARDGPVRPRPGAVEPRRAQAGHRWPPAALLLRTGPPDSPPARPPLPPPSPRKLSEGGVLFFRESCFRQSGDKSRGSNPTHYRCEPGREAKLRGRRASLARARRGRVAPRAPGLSGLPLSARPSCQPHPSLTPAPTPARPRPCPTLGTPGSTSASSMRARCCGTTAR
jgi:hypothetical protein